MEGTFKAPISHGKLIREQEVALQKLLESQAFAAAPRLRTVLSYLIRALENGTVDQVSEQSIGQDVFGKPAGYNATEDNIVRVTIRHLRNRLDDYYLAEGRGECWVLSIPKGKYVPLLLPVDPAVPPGDGLTSPVVSEPDAAPTTKSSTVAASPVRELRFSVRPVGGCAGAWPSCLRFSPASRQATSCDRPVPRSTSRPEF